MPSAARLGRAAGGSALASRWSRGHPELARPRRRRHHRHAQPRGPWATLERFGFTPRVIDPTAAHDTPQRIGPCTFVLIGADALGVDSGELVRGFRRISPYAPVLLFDRYDDARSTLVAAMRAGVTEVVDPVRRRSLRRSHHRRSSRSPAPTASGCSRSARTPTMSRSAAPVRCSTIAAGETGSACSRSAPGVPKGVEAGSKESLMAARLIGGQLLAGDLSMRDLGDLVLTSRLIDGVVAALDPTVVYVHSRNDDNHDHRAVHEATLRAVRAVPQVYAYQSPSSTPAFDPTKLVPIDDVVTAKADLLRLLAGQGRPFRHPA